MKKLVRLLLQGILGKRFSFLVVLFLPVFAFAVERPLITHVQIDPDTDMITLNWGAVAEDIDFYIIAERDEGSGFSQTKDTVAKEQTHYSFFQTERQAKEYTVIASKGGSSSTGSVWHSIMLLDNTGFDPCTYTATFSWNAYKGWESQGGVAKYLLYDAHSGMKMVEGTSTALSVSGLQPNTNYRFYVVAERHDGVRSSSYSVDLDAEGEEIPAYLHAALSVESGFLRLYGELDPSSDIRRFRIRSSRSGGVSGSRVITVDGTSFVFDERDSYPNLYSYSYQVEALNECGAVLLASEKVNHIRLNAMLEGDLVQLQWNAYKPDTDDGYVYKVYRVLNENQVELLSSEVSGLFYQDDVALLRYTEDAPVNARICYYVETTDMTIGVTSRSNVVCEEFVPNVAIPNAFTPNGDGINDIFMPIFDFHPQAYRMIIYNQWGGRVFESSDPSLGWDGTSGGTKLGQGSYTYSIYILTADGHAFYYRGGVSIINP